MWLIAKHGFVSIVEKPRDRPQDRLTLRAASGAIWSTGERPCCRP
jgi:hypothetical protein